MKNSPWCQDVLFGSCQMLYDSCKDAKSYSILVDSNDICVDRVIFMACSWMEPRGDLITFWPKVNACYISQRRQRELFETMFRDISLWFLKFPIGIEPRYFTWCGDKCNDCWSSSYWSIFKKLSYGHQNL